MNPWIALVATIVAFLAGSSLGATLASRVTLGSFASRRHWTDAEWDRFKIEVERRRRLDHDRERRWNDPGKDLP